MTLKDGRTKIEISSTQGANGLGKPDPGAPYVFPATWALDGSQRPSKTERRDDDPNLDAEQLKANMERIYHDWDKALSENDAEGLLKLYAKDAAIESPLIPHLLGKEEGICRGREQIGPFFEAVANRKPEIRQYHRTGYLSDGKKKMMFEYPRAAPKSETDGFRRSHGTE